MGRDFWVALIGLLVPACGAVADGPHAGQGGSGGSGGSGGGYIVPVSCFGKGTRIATASGSIAIEDVRVGDLVQAFDLTANRVVEEPVTFVFVHTNQPVGLLQTAFGSLRVTANHPIYDASRHAFVPAGSLVEPFATLELVSNWSTAPGVLGAFSLLAETETVYNLTVAEVHTYFADGVLVHNKERCGYPGDPPDCPCLSGDTSCGPLSTGGTTGAGGIAGGGLGGVAAGGANLAGSGGLGLGAGMGGELFAAGAGGQAGAGGASDAAAGVSGASGAAG